MTPCLFLTPVWGPSAGSVTVQSREKEGVRFWWLPVALRMRTFPKCTGFWEFAQINILDDDYMIIWIYIALSIHSSLASNEGLFSKTIIIHLSKTVLDSLKSAL